MYLNQMYLLEDRVKSFKDCSAILDTDPRIARGKVVVKFITKTYKILYKLIICTFFSNNEKTPRKECEQGVNSDF